MATEVTCIVDTDGTQSPDYTSLAAAIVGETGASPKCVTSADLVVNDEQLTIECRATSGAADTTAVTISGFTTSADCYIKVYVPPAHRHAGSWNTGKYRLSVSGEVIDTLKYDVAHILVDGLQIEYTGTGNNRQTVRFNLTGTRWYVLKNCIVRRPSSATGSGLRGVYLGGASSTHHLVENCIIYGFSGTGGSAIISSSNALTGNVLNCTIYDCETGISGGSKYSSVTNCAVFGCGDDFSTSNVIDHCASDDGDGTNAVDISPNATEADDWAAAFTDYTNGDFSLKSGSPLIDAGTDLSAYMDAVDIIGTSRPQGSAWDIGAFEYVVSGGLSIPVAMHHYNLLRSA